MSNSRDHDGSETPSAWCAIQEFLGAGRCPPQGLMLAYFEEKEVARAEHLRHLKAQARELRLRYIRNAYLLAPVPDTQDVLDEIGLRSLTLEKETQ